MGTLVHVVNILAVVVGLLSVKPTISGQERVGVYIYKYKHTFVTEIMRLVMFNSVCFLFQ